MIAPARASWTSERRWPERCQPRPPWKSLRPCGRSQGKMCSRSGAAAEQPPSVAGSSGPRERASRARPKRPLRISKRRSAMSSWGTQSQARCSGGPRASAASREPVSAPSAAPVATWRETITIDEVYTLRRGRAAARFRIGAEPSGRREAGVSFALQRHVRRGGRRWPTPCEAPARRPPRNSRPAPFWVLQSGECPPGLEQSIDLGALAPQAHGAFWVANTNKPARLSERTTRQVLWSIEPVQERIALRQLGGAPTPPSFGAGFHIGLIVLRSTRTPCW